ncbi:MAG: hypothetical protein AAF682_28575 [Planctomycetota bacterium]
MAARRGDAWLGLRRTWGWLPPLLTALVAGVLLLGVAEGLLFANALVRGGDLAGLTGLVLGAMALLIYVAVPGAVGLLFALPVVALWRRPRRILVLRRFHQRRGDRELRRLLRRSAAPLGHVYTLSDPSLSVPWMVRFPVLLSHLLAFQFHLRTVRGAPGVRRVARAVEVTWLRNLNWALSFRKVFAVRTDGRDESWRPCVRSLARSADAVLVDVRAPNDNVRWELGHCAESGQLDKVVLLTSEERHAASRAYVDRLALAGLGGRPWLVVDRDDRRAALETLREVADGAERAAPAPDPVPNVLDRVAWSYAESVAGLLGLALGPALWLAPLVIGFFLWRDTYGAGFR